MAEVKTWLVKNTAENEAALVNLGYKLTAELPKGRFSTHQYITNSCGEYLRGVTAENKDRMFGGIKESEISEIGQL